MKLTNIHAAWGSIIEFDSPHDFFVYPKHYWRNLIYQRKLLIFKKMHFQLTDYAKFSHHFGRPWDYEEYFKSREVPVEIIDGHSKYAVSKFSNRYKDFGNVIATDKEMDWHADIPNDKLNPFPFRALWIVKKPQNDSGTTHWLNIEDCFDCLDPELKSLIKDVNVVQQSWHNFNTGVKFHDFIKTHPITGKQSLRLNFYATEQIKNAWIIKVFVKLVEQADCSLIQKYIDNLLEYKELYHSHTWDLHDIAIYDNYSFIHGRTPIILDSDKENNERTFYRINIDHMTDDQYQKSVLPPATSISTIK